jgi:hypothetical protein
MAALEDDTLKIANNGDFKALDVMCGTHEKNLDWRTWQNFIHRDGGGTNRSNGHHMKMAVYEQRGPYANEVRFNKTDTCLRMTNTFYRGGGVFRVPTE